LLGVEVGGAARGAMALVRLGSLVVSLERKQDLVSRAVAARIL
jgi:hypothetical protein